MMARLILRLKHRMAHCKCIFASCQDWRRRARGLGLYRANDRDWRKVGVVVGGGGGGEVRVPFHMDFEIYLSMASCNL